MTEEKIKSIIEPKGWVIEDKSNKKTGQAVIYFLQNPTTGKRGVFRYLKELTEKSIKRFKRDISIVTDDKYKHPNIIKVLDFSIEDTFWCISERGEDFGTYWEKIRSSNLTEEQKVDKALDIIMQLLSGLINLHKAGVIHRDIKPLNIVVNNDQPVLIDFGLVYVPWEERISDEESVVANRRFSPDPMMYFQDTIPAWYDVYEMSQLLMWMVCDKPVKASFVRPLDWRFVRYAHGLDVTYIMRLRTIASLCNSPENSPKNAEELLALIERIFIEKQTNTSIQIPNMKEILETIQKGDASKLLKTSLEHSKILEMLPLYVNFCSEFEEALGLLAISLKDGGLVVSEIDQFLIKNYEQIVKEMNPQNIYIFSCIFFKFSYGGQDGGDMLRFESFYNIHTQKGTTQNSAYKDVVDMPMIQFTINISERYLGDGITKNYYVMPTNEGRVNLYILDEKFVLVEETNVTKLIDLIRDAILDTKVWEALYK